MTLTLYLHPLASFCHKVLIALYENGTAFDSEIVDFGNPDSAAALLDKWPVGKIPVLHDQAARRTIPETSIIIEYLQARHPGPVRLLPDDPEELLQVRLWDRFYDLYVSVPVQKIVTDRIRPADAHDPHGVAQAHATLDQAYKMIEAHMQEKLWATGNDFTMADCAALPALFFASIVHPFTGEQQALSSYLERLLQRSSVKRVLSEAQPYFSMFPYREAMPARYLEAAVS
ncbi:glutathione S-transferase [Rhizobium sp. BK529]|uniref:glutathione S-transferase family protein n=1 Tax=unclassified Rhizobium TaxID=2613769 RepID=UPI00104F4477|nr:MULTISPECIES: glutathione S-transferase family protein [unclassified Rhizobium]MBB3591992.1 glutathione S-transferase [Rhizobium sp. BK529]TCS06416.1 glutathione S-transferase [Rhizobium sp. BK418]